MTIACHDDSLSVQRVTTAQWVTNAELVQSAFEQLKAGKGAI